MALTRAQQNSIFEAEANRLRKGKPPLFQNRTERLKKLKDQSQPTSPNLQGRREP